MSLKQSMAKNLRRHLKKVHRVFVKYATHMVEKMKFTLFSRFDEDADVNAKNLEPDVESDGVMAKDSESDFDSDDSVEKSSIDE